MEVSLSEKALLEEHGQHFTVAGFDWQFPEDGTLLQITGVPMELTQDQAVPALEKILENVSELEDLAASELLKTLALGVAKNAARSALPKTAEELNTLRERLLSSSNPQFSPTGKKIIAELSQQDLVNLL